MTAGFGGGGQGPSTHALLGVGLDAEQVARFEKLAAGGDSWRHVYSAREAGHLAAQPQAARAFCAAFCCKEALCKALGAAYAFPEFECLYLPGTPEPEFVLAPGFAERHGIEAVRVWIDEQFLSERGEFVVEVYLIRRRANRVVIPATAPPRPPAAARPAGSRLETLLVGAVDAGRRRIEEEHFSPREIADLGRRRVQSLAGFLALKRALARLWVDAGAAAALAPRDFELGHHASGAPRLVAAPQGVALADVFVSISHTRLWAYGLAATGR
jgi:phosphopantetheinyl transferase (holo-ACP synthase)